MSESTETCGSCRYRLINPENIKETVCRRFPPQAHAVPQQGRMGQMQIGFIAQYPPVNPKMPACGEYMSVMRMAS